MKKFLLVLSCLVAVAVHAQNADEVIQKYTGTMGGLDAINKLESAKITGTLGSQGQKFPLTVYIINTKSMRTDVTVNGKVVSNVYDKGAGWKINPYENISTATEVTAADDLAQLKTQANLANNLMDYKKRGHTVEYVGQEVVDGQTADKIKLTSKDDGKLTTYFIGKTDHLLIRSDSKQKIQGNEYDAQTFYSDFKEYKGLKFATHFVRKIEGTIFQEVNYENVELNVPIDEKIFKMPK